MKRLDTKDTGAKLFGYSLHGSCLPALVAAKKPFWRDVPPLSKQCVAGRVSPAVAGGRPAAAFVPARCLYLS